MAIMYNLDKKYSLHSEGDSLTEQEHKNSCDINLMIKSARNGQNIRGGGSITYGFDDTTMDGLTFRNQKSLIEQELLNSEKELPKEALDLIPESIKQKFGFKLRKKKDTNDKTNDKTNENGKILQSNIDEPKHKDDQDKTQNNADSGV